MTLTKEDFHETQVSMPVPMSYERLIPFDAQLTDSVKAVQAHMKGEGARKTGRSNAFGYALNGWAQELESGTEIETERLQELVQRYVALVYPSSGGKNPKKTVYVNEDMAGWVEYIAVWLEKFRGRDGWEVPMLYSKSGYNSTLVLILALEKRARELNG